MRHKRVVVAATAGVAAAALLAAPVAAQEEEPPLLPISVTPASGPPGTVFTFAGEDCIGEEGPGEVLITVFFTDNEVVDEFALTPEADGSWAVDFDTGVPEPLPPGVYNVTATCFASAESDKVIAEYDFAAFELTAPPEPPKPPAPEPEPAQPAAPVVAKPTFTG